MVFLNPLDRLRLQRGAEYLHQLGPRATAELLAEAGDHFAGIPWLLDLLAEYERRLTPRMIRLAGGDRFPRLPVRAVPR
jgi:hypothetical protein